MSDEFNNKKRYNTLLEKFCASFPDHSKDARFFTAAGRTEICGNHTDHNHGKVLAASIQLDAVAVTSRRNDKKVLFHSTGFPDVEVDISDENLEPKNSERGTTEALVRGIAHQFVKNGTTVYGWNAFADSTVIAGSGLSSSAAIEVLLGTIFNYLYADAKYTPLQIAQIGQKAENVFFGKPSGLMDQAASALGGVTAMDFACKDNPLIERIDFDPEAYGYALCVVDTKGSHADLTPDYAAIPAEMRTVANFFGKDFLREISLEDVIARINEIRQACGDRALLRAIHFFEENRRVEKMMSVLKNIAKPDAAGSSYALEKYMSLVNESGTSSFELLQNCYSPDSNSAQGIPLALALTKDFFKTISITNNVLPAGACRVHGGGFAGTIQVYILKEYLSSYISCIEKVFGNGSVTVLKIRPVGTAEVFV